MKIVEHAIRCQWDVAMGGGHDLYLYTSLDRLSKFLFQFLVEGQLTVDELVAILFIVDGVIVERTYDAVRRARFAVDDAHRCTT